MTPWREQGLWSKVGVWAWLTLLMVIPGASEAGWLSGSSSNRKRVFSPGFVAFCVLAAVVELIAMNRFYGSRG